MKDEMLTYPEASEFSGYKKNYLYSLVTKGKLKSTKFGKKRIKKADLVKFMEGNKDAN